MTEPPDHGAVALEQCGEGRFIPGPKETIEQRTIGFQAGGGARKHGAQEAQHCRKPPVCHRHAASPTTLHMILPNPSRFLRLANACDNSDPLGVLTKACLRRAHLTGYIIAGKYEPGIPSGTK